MIAAADDTPLRGTYFVAVVRTGVERRGSVDPGGLFGRAVTLTFLPGFEPAEKEGVRIKELPFIKFRQSRSFIC